MHFRLLSILAGMVLAFAASAQSTPTEGIDYVELKPPLPTESAGKVEVIEFFWYRCPHCYALEPDLESWVKRLPRDAQFRRVPGILNEDWAVDARIFYTLEALGQVDRLHRPLFDAIHQQGGVRLRGDAFAKWVAEWLSKQGVDMKKYDELYRSFTVQTKTNRAIQMSRAYRLDGVPTLAVQGRYVIVASTTRKAMLSTTDFLIGEARRRLAKSGR
ncbi:MAG TPA: thiol:disulfide interchange protein DsbA/DsbL [Burkholderiales bacterium]|nr:thiol:disulfide interchange protein DsbA/DsbL [Burkholderiales bacterium]